MTRSWELSGMELFVLRDKLMGRPLPAPLSFISDIKLDADFQRAKVEEWERLQFTLDPDLRELLEESAFPDIRVRVRAWSPQDEHDPSSRIRIVATRTGSRGLMIRQLMGETAWHAAGFRLTEFDATRLADLIVDEIPPAPPGAYGHVDLIAHSGEDAMDHWHGRNNIRDTGDYVDNRSAAWSRVRAERVGIIDVLQARSIFGPRGQAERRIFWQDNIDDGRYAILLGTAVAAKAIDSAELLTMINRDIADVVRAIKDESRQPDAGTASVYDR